MSLIIYPQENDLIAVIAPTGEISIEEVAVKDVPADTPYTIVDVLDIDMGFFSAYKYNGGSPVFDSTLGKEIHLNHFREARTPLLAALDIEFMKTVESGDTAAQAVIAAKKQALRDVTLTPLPDDLEGIKAVWPSILNG